MHDHLNPLALRIMLLRCTCFLLPGLLAILLPGLRPSLAQQAADADREYILETNILGYWGVGGDINGVRNPVLRAEKGETVRIVIVNIEPLVHDLALETLQIKTKEILDIGEQTDLTFTAVEDDIYYCTIPGHRAAGMEGRFEIIREAGVAAGPAPEANGGNGNTARVPSLSELPPPENIPLPPLELPPDADLQATGSPTNTELTALLDHPNEHIRARAVQLLAEDGNAPEHVLNTFARMAREDTSALVRTYLAETLRKIEPERRWRALEGLHSHTEDAANYVLPLLVWYATEAAVPADMDRALTIALVSELPNILSFTVQRIAAEGSQEALRILSGRLPEANAEERKIILNGINRIVKSD